VSALAGVTAVWAEDVLRHEPGAEVWVGVSTPGTELPERATVIRDAVVAAGAHVAPALAGGGAASLAEVHTPEFLAHLEAIHGQWMAGEYFDLVGQDRVVPYVFPTPAMLEGLPLRNPAAVHARAGLYCYDTMTLVGPGTWPAAIAAVDAAATAAELAWTSRGLAYAICRPPGHHATTSGYGGSCYLNNAAVAASQLRSLGAERVAVIDIDAHHGNGTQSIFYSRTDVRYASTHVDPGAGWFPHYAGFADEIGTGDGVGANLNVPLAPGSGDDAWLTAVEGLCRFAGGVDAIVVSLGVDAAELDPESPLRVSLDGYRQTGALIASLGVPTVAVHEGGYHLPTLGDLTVATLTGLHRAA